jgi:hypothetical protein
LLCITLRTLRLYGADYASFGDAQQPGIPSQEMLMPDQKNQQRQPDPNRRPEEERESIEREQPGQERSGTGRRPSEEQTTPTGPDRSGQRNREEADLGEQSPR